MFELNQSLDTEFTQKVKVSSRGCQHLQIQINALEPPIKADIFLSRFERQLLTFNQYFCVLQCSYLANLKSHPDSSSIIAQRLLFLIHKDQWFLCSPFLLLSGCGWCKCPPTLLSLPTTPCRLNAY